MIELLIIYLLVINVITFVTYGIDKAKAKNREWRIPESVLLWLAVFGGSIGAFAAMKVFHHKTQHIQFQLGIPAILLLQLVLAALYFLYA